MLYHIAKKCLFAVFVLALGGSLSAQTHNNIIPQIRQEATNIPFIYEYFTNGQEVRTVATATDYIYSTGATLNIFKQPEKYQFRACPGDKFFTSLVRPQTSPTTERLLFAFYPYENPSWKRLPSSQIIRLPNMSVENLSAKELYEIMQKHSNLVKAESHNLVVKYGKSAKAAMPGQVFRLEVPVVIKGIDGKTVLLSKGDVVVPDVSSLFVEDFGNKFFMNEKNWQSLSAKMQRYYPNMLRIVSNKDWEFATEKIAQEKAAAAAKAKALKQAHDAAAVRRAEGRVMAQYGASLTKLRELVYRTEVKLATIYPRFSGFFFPRTIAKLAKSSGGMIAQAGSKAVAKGTAAKTAATAANAAAKDKLKIFASRYGGPLMVALSVGGAAYFFESCSGASDKDAITSAQSKRVCKLAAQHKQLAEQKLHQQVLKTLSSAEQKTLKDVLTLMLRPEADILNDSFLAEKADKLAQNPQGVESLLEKVAKAYETKLQPQSDNVKKAVKAATKKAVKDTQTVTQKKRK